MSLSRLRSASCGVVAAALPFLLMTGCKSKETNNNEDTTPTAPVVTAERTSLANKLTVAGTFVPYQEVELHAKVAGYIRQIYVDIGDKVRKGQVLATLDVPELLAQVTGAGAGVAQSREQIARAKSEVARAVADHVALHSNYTRLADAAKSQPGIIAQQELDNAKARDQAAESAVEAAKSSLAATQQALGMTQAQQSQVQSMADYSRITAPFDGIVTWRYADPGALIQSGTSNAASAPVVKIAQVDTLRLRLPVPEALASFVKVGAPAEISVGALHRSFSGTVTRTTGALDPATRSMQVEVDVPNKDHTLAPGMYAQVTLDIKRAGDALAVPVQAVDMSGAQPWLYVVDGSNHLVKRHVQLGVSTPNRVEIASGVNAGDRVVSTGIAQYNPGELVKPKTDVMAAFNASEGGK